MKIVASGVAVAGKENTDQQSNSFPGICVLPNGRWLCGYRSSPFKSKEPGQAARLTWSDDEGATWSEPIMPLMPPKLEGRPGVLRCLYCTPLGGSDVVAAIMWQDHSDPTLPMFNPKTEGVLDLRLMIARSSDNGETWSDLQEIDQPFYKVPLAITGPILVLPNGEWIYHSEVNKHYDDAETVWHHSSVFMISKDQGRTWPELAVASSCPENRYFYWDQRPQLLDNGKVLDLFWSFDNKEAKYINIQAREFNPADRSWSEMWNTGIPGQPAPPVSLADGRIVMVYVDREGSPTLKARTSNDGGRTWPDATELILHETAVVSQTWDKGKMEDAWNEMGKFSLGLPATTLLPNGDVLAVYYQGPHSDYTDIRWVRFTP